MYDVKRREVLAGTVGHDVFVTSKEGPEK